MPIPFLIVSSERIGHVFQQVAGLAVQSLADGFKRGETHSLGFAGLEDGEVGRRDADPLGKLTGRHLSAGQHHIDVDNDRHSYASSLISSTFCASTDFPFR